MQSKVIKRISDVWHSLDKCAILFFSMGGETIDIRKWPKPNLSCRQVKQMSCQSWRGRTFRWLRMETWRTGSRLLFVPRSHCKGKSHPRKQAVSCMWALLYLKSLLLIWSVKPSFPRCEETMMESALLSWTVGRACWDHLGLCSFYHTVLLFFYTVTLSFLECSLKSNVRLLFVVVFTTQWRQCMTCI